GGVLRSARRPPRGAVQDASARATPCVPPACRRPAPRARRAPRRPGRWRRGPACGTRAGLPAGVSRAFAPLLSIGRSGAPSSPSLPFLRRPPRGGRGRVARILSSRLHRAPTEGLPPTTQGRAGPRRKSAAARGRSTRVECAGAVPS
ncbi:unnamed protein product, partial [Prorocentrum cordatum]